MQSSQHPTQHTPSSHPDSAGKSSEQFWDEFYGGGNQIWSGKPNRALVDETQGLRPGTALDLGCGQGGDAIWLAAQGWTVTGTDISEAALKVAAEHAAAAGVAPGAITWERHDFAVSLPAGPFDLVTASFLHSPVELPRYEILLRSAALVAPGGTLLVIGHAPSASHPHADLPTPEELVDGLALPSAEWTLTTSELRTHLHAFADEAPVERIDAVVRLTKAA
jgi:SAM-dependent methyltransferase